MGGFSAAEYYEAFADAEGRLAREGPLLEECLHRAPGLRVVDIACGTGLHARFFAGLGAHVTALDVSPEMVAYAREHRPHPAIKYRAADMRTLRGGPWDLALCLGNSLSLLGSFEEVAATFRAVFAALEPGGLFLLQVLDYASQAAQQPRHRVERRTVGDANVVAVKSLVPHEDCTLLSLTYHLLRQGRHDALTETALLLHVTRERITRAAEDTGFAVDSVWGGFDRSTFHEDASQDVVCLLARPRQ